MFDLFVIFYRAVIGLAAIILFTRMAGLRSFSKMSAFDFAVTVAMGSVLAAIVTTLDLPLWKGLAALATLFLVQMAVAYARPRWSWISETVDNRPLLIMENGKPLDDNLKAAQMTHDDLWGKLREANAWDLSTVKAVVFEPTGDVSVLHGEGALSDEITQNWRR